MATYREEVAIIKAREIGEADKIFTLFGKRRGRFSAIAKSVRKISSRKMGHLQTGNICKVTCAEGKSLDILVEAEAILTIDPKSLNIRQHEYLGFCGMIVDKLIPEGISDPDVFEGWNSLMAGSILEDDMVDFSILVLKNQGFLSEEQEKSFRMKSDERFTQLQKYVTKILDTI